MLLNGSPFLEAITLELLEDLHRTTLTARLQDMVGLLSRALAFLGMLDTGIEIGKTYRPFRVASGEDGAASATWVQWCQRWLKTSTLADRTKKHSYYDVLKAGRWLAQHHPEVTSPAQWTHELAIEFVAAVTHLTIGEWGYQPLASIQKQRGKMLRPSTKRGLIASLRVFFQDCQQWQWIPRHF